MEKMASMNFPRNDHTMEAVNGKLMVFGGASESRNTLETSDGNVWKMEILNVEYGNHASIVVPCK